MNERNIASDEYGIPGLDVEYEVLHESLNILIGRQVIIGLDTPASFARWHES